MVYLIYSFFPYGLLQYWLSSIKNRNKLNNTKKKQPTSNNNKKKSLFINLECWKSLKIRKLRSPKVKWNLKVIVYTPSNKGWRKEIAGDRRHELEAQGPFSNSRSALYSELSWVANKRTSDEKQIFNFFCYLEINSS